MKPITYRRMAHGPEWRPIKKALWNMLKGNSFIANADHRVMSVMCDWG